MGKHGRIHVPKRQKMHCCLFASLVHRRQRKAGLLVLPRGVTFGRYACEIQECSIFEAPYIPPCVSTPNLSGPRFFRDDAAVRGDWAVLPSASTARGHAHGALQVGEIAHVAFVYSMKRYFLFCCPWQAVMRLSTCAQRRACVCDKRVRRCFAAYKVWTDVVHRPSFV